MEHVLYNSAKDVPHLQKCGLGQITGGEHISRLVETLIEEVLPTAKLERRRYNELKNFSDEEKEDLSYDFADKYEGKLQNFINFISDPQIAAPGSYKSTWAYIEKGANSLHRCSNMHLIFQ